MYFAPIVEGHGEVAAVPAILHRVAMASGIQVRVNKPIRVKAGSFLTSLESQRKYVELAARKAAQESGSVLILLDCEDHCPGKVGPELTSKVRSLRSDVPILVNLAYREFETWFLTAAASLRGVCGLPLDLEPPPSPEAIRDAKGWLTERMEAPYDPVIHQVEFSRKIDLEMAASNESFARLTRIVSAVARARGAEN